LSVPALLSPPSPRRSRSTHRRSARPRADPSGIARHQTPHLLSVSPRAMPTAVEIAVPACPTLNRSYGDSARLRKARHALARPQPQKQRQPTRQQLVRVALVPHVKEQPVVPENQTRSAARSSAPPRPGSAPGDPPTSAAVHIFASTASKARSPPLHAKQASNPSGGGSITPPRSSKPPRAHDVVVLDWEKTSGEFNLHRLGRASHRLSGELSFVFCDTAIADAKRDDARPPPRRRHRHRPHQQAGLVDGRLWPLPPATPNSSPRASLHAEAR
jgi:hypothetical protein